MAEASFFLEGLKDVLLGNIQLNTDPVKMALVDDNYVFDPETVYFDTGDDDTNDPSNNVITATNYAHADATGEFSADTDAATDDGVVRITCTDISFGVLGGAANDTIAGVVLFKDSGDETTSPVIAYLPLDSNKVTTGVTEIIQWDPIGGSDDGNLRVGLPSQSGS